MAPILCYSKGVMTNTTYISIDIEANGDVPGKYSMLSLGAAAYDRSGTVLTTFEQNFETLPGAIENPDTMAFWARFPTAYEATRRNLVSAQVGMELFTLWFERLENPVFVFYPPKFDAMFVYWYLQTYVDRMNFISSPDMFDTKTLAAILLRVDNLKEASKKHWPKRWKNKKLRHNHVALDDALEQGEQFIKILNEALHGTVETGGPPKR